MGGYHFFRVFPGNTHIIAKNMYPQIYELFVMYDDEMMGFRNIGLSVFRKCNMACISKQSCYKVVPPPNLKKKRCGADGNVRFSRYTPAKTVNSCLLFLVFFF